MKRILQTQEAEKGASLPVVARDAEATEVTETAENLHKLTLYVQSRSKRQRNGLVGFLSATIAAPIILQIVLNPLLASDPATHAMLLGSSAILLVIFAITIPSINNRIVRRFDGGVERLAEESGVEVMPALLDALNLGDANLRLEAIKGLVRILSQLQPADASRLTARHKWRLRLTASRDTEQILYQDVRTLFHLEGGERSLNRLLLDFRLAALKALGETGDRSDLRLLQQLAQKATRTPAQKEVRQGAEIALSRLKERLAETEPQRLLLRASGVQATPEELLRPSRSESEAPEELLRPNANPKSRQPR
jgi:hypothetical protein